jgi:hypothetical protein
MSSANQNANGKLKRQHRKLKLHSWSHGPERIYRQNILNSCGSATGGEGPLALLPLWFQLYAVKDCIDLCHANQHVLENFPTFMFFGSNGGLESIAFDLRVGPPWPIVMIDQIAGPESAKEIAPNMGAFIEAIGIEAEGQADC